MVLVAFINKIILADKAIKKPVYHQADVLPVVSLALPKQDANPTSSNPAMIKIIKFMLCFFAVQRSAMEARNNFTNDK